jgi:dihydroxyacetone kinase DhaKLM complex PTS-EIIA-like component DhaM
VRLADAPLVEGAVAAAITASVGQPLEAVVQAAEEARGASKL